MFTNQWFFLGGGGDELSNILAVTSGEVPLHPEAFKVGFSEIFVGPGVAIAPIVVSSGVGNTSITPPPPSTPLVDRSRASDV